MSNYMSKFKVAAIGASAVALSACVSLPSVQLGNGANISFHPSNNTPSKIVTKGPFRCLADSWYLGTAKVKLENNGVAACVSRSARGEARINEPGRSGGSIFLPFKLGGTCDPVQAVQNDQRIKIVYNNGRPTGYVCG